MEHRPTSLFARLLSRPWRPAVFLLLFAILACKVEEPPVKIGFVGELTGRYSDLGTAGRNGVILAVEEVNQGQGINGRRVELITKDDRHDPETAVKGVKELIREGVAAVIGPMTSTISMAALPLINREKVLMISPTASSSRLAGKDDWFLRVCGDVGQTGRRLAEHAFREARMRRMSAVYDFNNLAYTEAYVEAFRSRFEELGGRMILTQGYAAGTEPRFDKVAERVTASPCQGVLIAASAMDTAMICQQVNKKAPDLPIFSSAWGMTEEFIYNAGGAAEGVVFTWFFDWDSKEEAYVEFKRRFTSRFSRAPDYAALFGYEAACLLFDALSKNPDPRALRQGILGRKGFNGLQGRFEVDQYGDARRPVFVIMVSDARFRTVE